MDQWKGQILSWTYGKHEDLDTFFSAKDKK